MSQTAVLMAEMGEFVKPARRVDVFKDDPDNRVLECAEAGQAECIVTGYNAMMQLKLFGSILLVSIKEYL